MSENVIVPTDEKREQVLARVVVLIRDQLRTPAERMLVERAPAKNFAEALGCTSLDTVSIQIAVEDTFGIKFASGPSARTGIDEEWDAMHRIDDLVMLILKYEGK